MHYIRYPQTIFSYKKANEVFDQDQFTQKFVQLAQQHAWDIILPQQEKRQQWATSKFDIAHCIITPQQQLAAVFCLAPIDVNSWYLPICDLFKNLVFGYIGSCMVDTSFRWQKLGKTLMYHVVKYAQDQKFDWLLFDTLWYQKSDRDWQPVNPMLRLWEDNWFSVSSFFAPYYQKVQTALLASNMSHDRIDQELLAVMRVFDPKTQLLMTRYLEEHWVMNQATRSFL